jgi:hypothetical protein
MPLENGIDSTLINKIQIQNDETLIKFYKKPIMVVGEYIESTNYLCKNGNCRILIENDQSEIINYEPIKNIFQSLEYDFNTKIASEMYAYSSSDYNSKNEEIVFDGSNYGIYIQQNLKSYTLNIYEPKYYKNSSLQDYVRVFYKIFEKYFMYVD